MRFYENQKEFSNGDEMHLELHSGVFFSITSTYDRITLLHVNKLMLGPQQISALGVGQSH